VGGVVGHHDVPHETVSAGYGTSSIGWRARCGVHRVLVESASRHGPRVTRSHAAGSRYRPRPGTRLA
jgi:hypothetical protein